MKTFIRCVFFCEAKRYARLILRMLLIRVIVSFQCTSYGVAL